MSTHDGESDDLSGGPPIVLIAALGAALIIAVGLIAGFSSLGDDASEPVSDRGGGSATTTPGERVLLTVAVGGSGSGRVQITPSDVSCSASCEYKFMTPTRVTAIAEPSAGSKFDGWGDACSGRARCTFVMNRPRSLVATFAEQPAEASPCEEDVPPEEQDPACLPDDLDDPDAPAEPPEPGPDCADGIDNDNDGLTDTEQDPDCDASGSETPSTAAPGDASSPRTNECDDGKDNDRDGLTDSTQDPDCDKGRSESG